MTSPFSKAYSPQFGKRPLAVGLKVPNEVIRELDAHPTAIEDLALLWNAGETGRRLALEIADQFNARRTK